MVIINALENELKKYEDYNELNNSQFVITLIESELPIDYTNYRPPHGMDSIEFKRTYVKKEYKKREMHFTHSGNWKIMQLKTVSGVPILSQKKNNFAAIGL